MKSIPNEIKDYISYNPDTGTCAWKKSPGGQARVGKPLTSVDCKGYKVLRFRGVAYTQHRVVWFIHHGEDPGDKHVDHINRNKSDNRIENLRLVSQQGNEHNRYAKGITKVGKAWNASITAGNKQCHIGSYPCPLLAHLAYLDVKSILHPKYSGSHT